MMKLYSFIFSRNMLHSFNIQPNRVDRFINHFYFILLVTIARKLL